MKRTAGFEDATQLHLFYGDRLGSPGSLITALVWLGVAAITRYSSLSALIASVAAPIVLLLFGRTEIAVLAACLAIIIWIKHRANLQRLLRGEESRIGAG